MSDPGKPLDLRDFSDEVARQAGLTPDQLGRHKSTGVPDELLERAQPDAIMLPDRKIESTSEALKLLEDSYAEVVSDLQRFPGITWINGRLTFTDILGEPQPIPLWSEVHGVFAQDEAFIVEKMNEGFRTLVLVPFGMETKDLVHACLEQADANARLGKLHARDGSAVDANAVHLQDTFGLMSMTQDEEMMYSLSGGFPLDVSSSKGLILTREHRSGWQMFLIRDSDVERSGLNSRDGERSSENSEGTDFNELRDLASSNHLAGERFMSIDDYWMFAFMQQMRDPSHIDDRRSFVLASCVKTPGRRIPVIDVVARDKRRFTYRIRSMGERELFPVGWEAPTVVPLFRNNPTDP